MACWLILYYWCFVHNDYGVDVGICGVGRDEIETSYWPPGGEIPIEAVRGTSSSNNSQENDRVIQYAYRDTVQASYCH